jgi:putative phosphonate metabolism protein
MYSIGDAYHSRVERPFETTLTNPLRYAIYFAPQEHSMLWRTGCRWLGRDPVSGATLEQPAVAGFESSSMRELTAAPRRYGFHATLKPPFALVPGMSDDELYAELTTFAHSFKPFRLPRLELTRIGGFLALCLSQPCVQLDTLAAECVARFDRFRRPASSAERARRADRLSANQKMLVDLWGYPYVMDEWRFHMTLTGPLDDKGADTIGEFLMPFFVEALREVTWVGDLCVFVEPRCGSDFRLAARFPLAQS